MKKIFIIVLLLSSVLVLNAQVKGLQISTQKEQRSLTMFYGNLSDKSENSVVFIDRKQVSFMEFLSVNSKFIDTYSVEKKQYLSMEKNIKSNYILKQKMIINLNELV